ncbi:MAG TPA: hypothetical protein VGG12_08635 [Methylovirgula sp.]
MVSFTFSAEQVKAAPAEVRRWMEGEIMRSLAGGKGSAAAAAALPESAEGLGHSLAAGTAQEMQDTFKRIAGNAIVARLFFELARDSSVQAGTTPFHVVALVEVMRHLHLVEAQQVLTCLDAINQAFQQIRRDPQASLFAMDEAGYVYLHQLTYHAIRQVWQQLVAAQIGAA